MSNTTYADGTYGANSHASRGYADDQHNTFTGQQGIVLSMARLAGVRGITGHDIQQTTGWGDSSKSRALSNLLRDGKVVRLQEKRDRGSVHVLPEHVDGRAIEPYESIADRHYARGMVDGASEGELEGLRIAFTVADAADSLGEALITLRRLIGEHP